MFPMSEGDKHCSENPNIKTTSVKLTPGCRSLFVLVFFLVAIVLSVLLRFTASEYPFGIF